MEELEDALFRIAILTAVAAYMLKFVWDADLGTSSAAFVKFGSYALMGLLLFISPISGVIHRRRRSVYYMAAILAVNLFFFSEAMQSNATPAIVKLLATGFMLVAVAAVVTEIAGLIFGRKAED